MLDQAAYDRAQEAQEYRDEVLDALIGEVEQRVMRSVDPLDELVYGHSAQAVNTEAFNALIRRSQNPELLADRPDITRIVRDSIVRIAESQLDARLAELKRQADEDRAESQR